MDSKEILSADESLKLLSKYYDAPTKAIGNLSLQQFFNLMFYTLNIEKPGLAFVPSWPQYIIPDTAEYKKTMDNPVARFVDTISYMITREEPGSRGGDKQPFGSTRELNPRVRETKIVDKDTSSVVYGQWFDTLVQFDLWTLTNFEAEALALWFKRFMTIHRDFFKHMGLSEIHFWWRGRDAVSSALKNNLHLRSLVYFVRTEEISYESEYNLKEVQVKLESISK